MISPLITKELGLKKSIKVLLSVLFFVGVLIGVQKLFLKTGTQRGGDFELDGVSGKVKLSDFRGKNVLFYLGFTRCPDVCPTSLSVLSNVFEGLPDKVKSETQMIFISLDHKRDTPQVAQEYVEFYVPSAIGLAGSKESIDDIAKRYGAYYRFVDTPESSFKFSIDHTSKFYLIGREGKLLEVIRDNEGVDIIQKILIGASE